MTDADGSGGAAVEFDEGRYLYCAVEADDGESFAADGIEGRAVSLLVRDGVGVVVQPVDAVYDSDDPTQVRRWLLDHQEVVDDAGRRFGTPLPFRFDTVLRGGDATVREWLDDRREELEAALERLSGRWEYRVGVRWDEAAVGEAIRAEDDDLRELAERVESASEGTGFLLEKQYRKRLAERLEARRRRVAGRVHEAVEPHVVESRRTGDGPGLLSEDDEGPATVVRLSVLAPREREGAVGEALEPFAEREAYEVDYTGPWPPYSFAPAVDGGDEEA